MSATRLMLPTLSRAWAAAFPVLLTVLAAPATGGSNFARAVLGSRTSIEVPSNWAVVSGDRRVTVDDFVWSNVFRDSAPMLHFVARLEDDDGGMIALINAFPGPEAPITQAQVRQITADDLKQIDGVFKPQTEVALGDMGRRMTNWYGSRMEVVNGLHVLVHEHQQTNARGDGFVRVRGLRVWNNPRSFSVILHYDERDALTLLPIVDYMANSLRQD